MEHIRRMLRSCVEDTNHMFGVWAANRLRQAVLPNDEVDIIGISNCISSNIVIGRFLYQDKKQSLEEIVLDHPEFFDDMVVNRAKANLGFEPPLDGPDDFVEFVELVGRRDLDAIFIITNELNEKWEVINPAGNLGQRRKSDLLTPFEVSAELFIGDKPLENQFMAYVRYMDESVSEEETNNRDGRVVEFRKRVLELGNKLGKTQKEAMIEAMYEFGYSGLPESYLKYPALFFHYWKRLYS